MDTQIPQRKTSPNPLQTSDNLTARPSNSSFSLPVLPKPFDHESDSDEEYKKPVKPFSPLLANKPSSNEDNNDFNQHTNNGSNGNNNENSPTSNPKEHPLAD